MLLSFSEIYWSSSAISDNPSFCSSSYIFWILSFLFFILSITRSFCIYDLSTILFCPIEANVLPFIFMAILEFIALFLSYGEIGLFLLLAWLSSKIFNFYYSISSFALLILSFLEGTPFLLTLIILKANCLWASLWLPWKNDELS
jgi:hypothetical protein